MSDIWPGRTSSTNGYISLPPSPSWRTQYPRHLVILGSTGSIGRSALAVVASNPESFVIDGLSCATNVELLARQAALYRPAYLAVANEDARHALMKLLPSGYTPVIGVGTQGYEDLARVSEAETVLSAQSGAAGLAGTLSAALAGKVLCLANKESLVLAGRLVRRLCDETGAVILPVDSEHNAIFQCLAGRTDSVRSLILTASGGPFRDLPAEKFALVTPEQALNHPNWSMGRKITIDSATMMNKGLEVIEACHLFGVSPDQVEVLIHPQSLIHSMVRFMDGSVLAQAAVPDMKLPIAHCLLWPQCRNSVVPPLDFTTCGPLTFRKPDFSRFPCLALALEAYASGDDACCIANTANEVAVDLFLAGHISFPEIHKCIADAMAHVSAEDSPCEDSSLTDLVRHVKAHIEALEAKTREFILASLP